jgi:hypothetical protein
MHRMHRNDPVLYLLYVGTFVVVAWAARTLSRDWLIMYDA